MSSAERPLEDRFIQWVLGNLANRTSAYGRYKRDGGQYTEKSELTADIILAHFRGELTIGLHTTSLANTCRWCCWDIDAHDDQDRRATNWKTVLSLVASLQALGCDPIVEDSNGKGGLHVWLFFGEPVPAADAYAFVTRMAPDGVEAFPKQRAVRPTEGAPGSYGNYVRLPGRHHKNRDHWSRIFHNDEWFAWPEAAEILVDPPLSPAPSSDVSSGCAEGVEPLPVGSASQTAKARSQDTVPDGQRNSVLISFAGFMRRGGLREKEIGAALVAVNQDRCDPPLEESEVRKVAASVMQYDPDDPIQFATATPESQEEGLATVNGTLFCKHKIVSIRRFVRRGGPRGHVDAELADGQVVQLGTVSQILTFATFRKALAETTKIVIPPELTKKWPSIAQMILHLIEEEGGETVDDALHELLESLHEADPPLDADDPDEAAEIPQQRRKPFFQRGGKLYLRSEPFLNAVRQRTQIRLDQGGLAAWLGRKGWAFHKLSFGSRETRRRVTAYEAPDGWCR